MNPKYRLDSVAGRVMKSVKAIVKTLMLTHKAKLPEMSGEVVVLGNGPSLAQTIADHGDRLKTMNCMAVNFFANSPQFQEIKPKFYILADPHFFNRTEDVNVTRLLENLNRVDWKMTLLVPFKSGNLPLKSSENLEIVRYNCVGVEGWRWLTDRLYGSGRGMPRPRNVLIPAIMTSVVMGFNRIYIAGADHSWMRTISVDDDNCVVTAQPHFYKEDEKEIERVRAEYRGRPLYDVIDAFSIAFKAYWRIEDYASRHGVEIINVTPGSMIDAFSRGKLI